MVSASKRLSGKPLSLSAEHEREAFRGVLGKIIQGGRLWCEGKSR